MASCSQLLAIARIGTASCSVDLRAWSRSSPDNSLQERDFFLANLMLSPIMLAKVDESAAILITGDGIVLSISLEPDFDTTSSSRVQVIQS